MKKTCDCNKMRPCTMIAYALTIIGGLNWGLIAINSNWNIVSYLFPTSTTTPRIIYGLIGLSALILLIKMSIMHHHGECKKK